MPKQKDLMDYKVIYHIRSSIIGARDGEKFQYE